MIHIVNVHRHIGRSNPLLLEIGTGPGQNPQLFSEIPARNLCQTRLLRQVDTKSCEGMTTEIVNFWANEGFFYDVAFFYRKVGTQTIKKAIIIRGVKFFIVGIILLATICHTWR